MNKELKMCRMIIDNICVAVHKGQYTYETINSSVLVSSRENKFIPQQVDTGFNLYKIPNIKLDFNIDLGPMDILDNDLLRIIKFNQGKSYYNSPPILRCVNKIIADNTKNLDIEIRIGTIKDINKLSDDEIVTRSIDNIEMLYRCPICGRVNHDCTDYWVRRIHAPGFCCSAKVEDVKDSDNYVNYHGHLFPKKKYDLVMSKLKDCKQPIESGEHVTYFIREYVNLLNPNRRDVRVVDRFTTQCRHGHVGKIAQLELTKIDEPVDCPICKKIEGIEFFKLLDEIGVNYVIKEQIIPQSCIPRGLSVTERKLIKLIVYTKNDKGHLTGKIVFNDYDGMQQAKANRNNLVYRWLFPSKANDREYCKQYLHDFFEEINKRHNLK